MTDVLAWRRSRRDNRTGTLDVTDDGTGSVVHELNADLGNTTARACVAKQSAICSAMCAILHGRVRVVQNVFFQMRAPPLSSRLFHSADDGRWRIVVVLLRRRTGTAEDAGDLDELDGDLGGFHCEVLCDELR